MTRGAGVRPAFPCACYRRRTIYCHVLLFTFIEIHVFFLIFFIHRYVTCPLLLCWKYSAVLCNTLNSLLINEWSRLTNSLCAKFSPTVNDWVSIYSLRLNNIMLTVALHFSPNFQISFYSYQLVSDLVTFVSRSNVYCLYECGKLRSIMSNTFAYTSEKETI